MFKLFPGLVALVGVSLLTKPHNPREVEEFYPRIDTPVGEEHRLSARGIKLDLRQDLGSDADVTFRDPSRRLLFLDLLDVPRRWWRCELRWVDCKIDLIGGGACVTFVAAFKGLLSWGIAWLADGR